MSRMLWCTALIGLVMPVAAQADGPGCTPRMPCLQRKVCCLKQKLCDLTPRCVKATIYQPSCRTSCNTCRTGCNTRCNSQPQSANCQPQAVCCKKETEIERVVINMQQQQPAARLNLMQMQTVMVPQQRIVMVPQIQTFFTPTTVVGGRAFVGNGFNTMGVNNCGAVNAGFGAQNLQTNDATMRAMAKLIQQRLNQRSDTAARANTQPRSLQQLDADLAKLTKRVEALEAACKK